MIQIDSEFKALIPPLKKEEFEQLEQNIIADGCRDPLTTWQGFIIDGHNRYEICTKHNIEFKTVAVDLPSREAVFDWMDENQLGRRNLTPEQMSLLRGRIYNRSKKAQGGDRGNQYTVAGCQNVNLPKTGQILADKFGVSDRTIYRDGKFAESVEDLKEYVPDVESRVLSGEVKKRDIVEAATALKEIPEPERQELIAKGEAEILAKAKEIRSQKTKELRQQRVEKIAEIAQGNTELKSDVKYPVIYADPPWRYDYTSTENRAIENQYPTMTLDDICALDIPATDDAILFLWTTSPKLEEGLRVVRDWGFEYRTCAIWDKQKIGMGYYFRQQHEILLIATRGNIPAPEPANRPGSVFSFPRGEHSAKPHEVAEIIEKMYPEFPKLEMFCRSPRAGWGVWGNQSNAA